MKMKHLLGTTLLILLAACTNDEPLVPGTGEQGDSGAVSFSITGLSSGSTQSRAAIAVQEENEIKTLDIYVFAYDDNANLADAPNAAPATIDEGQWYLQEKWSYNDEAPITGNGTTLRSFTLGGSGVARTAVIYPQKGRFLRFFMVANADVLTNAADETAFAPAFTTLDAGTGAVATTGTSAADFLKLRLRPAKMDEANPARITNIVCPLPMTAQMTADVAKITDMRTTAQGGATDAPQTTLTAALNRAVARFDVINKAALLGSGDFSLTSVRVRNGFRYVGMANTIPAGSAFETAVEKDFDGMVWTDYQEGDPAVKTGEMLTSAFYTSPTLGGADDPMVISLYGETGRKAQAAPNYSGGRTDIQPLNKDVEVRDAGGNKIEVKANYRYVLTIEKMVGGNLTMAFSVMDWSSEILTPDLDNNTSMPSLLAADADGIVWSKRWGDKLTEVPDFKSVTIDNTAPGKTLGFTIRKAYSIENGTLDFAVRILGAVADKIWLEDAVMGPLLGSATTETTDVVVTLKVKSETEVPLEDRSDLALQVYNVQHPEMQLMITVKNTWKPEERPWINANPVIAVGDKLVANPAETPDINYDFTVASAACPDGWYLPTKADADLLAGATLDDAGVTVTDAAFFKAFPYNAADPLGTWYWLAGDEDADAAWCMMVIGQQAAVYKVAKTSPINVRCVKR
ncbi:hypothetical protein [Bacteroides sp.]